MSRLSFGGSSGRAFVAAVLLLSAFPALAGRDVMLVLDNSGSMRKNDPSRLAAPAVAEFIKGQPRDTRVGIVLFATTTELVMPLMPSEVAADGEADNALKKFSYRGAWTQTAAAVERGLYELRSEGRPEATRAIVLMTDGIIDTGNKAKDAELYEWLRKDLAEQAKKEGVRIFGIAFTEQADFQLLQSLASTTGGEYFRVLNAEGIARTLKRIDSIMAEPGATTAQPAKPAAPAVAEPAPTPAEQAPQPEAAAPAETPKAGGGWWKWLLAVLAALVAGGLGLAAWRRRGRMAVPASASSPEVAKHDGGPTAVLYNSTERHEIGAAPVVIGRAGGNDPTRQYVIVPEKTVGRWHATIERRGQTFWVRDEGSVNGTFINDERVIGEQPLKHRDTLRVHTHKYEFEIPELADADRTMMSPRSRLSA